MELGISIMIMSAVSASDLLQCIPSASYNALKAVLGVSTLNVVFFSAAPCVLWIFGGSLTMFWILCFEELVMQEAHGVYICTYRIDVASSDLTRHDCCIWMSDWKSAQKQT